MGRGELRLLVALKNGGVREGLEVDDVVVVCQLAGGRRDANVRSVQPVLRQAEHGDRGAERPLVRVARIDIHLQAGRAPFEESREEDVALVRCCERGKKRRKKSKAYLSSETVNLARDASVTEKSARWEW